ncbi:recombinase family protein [Alicyclobacillus acidoterrestris]|uniref:Recombinase family protein n=1 Tax=Alicyclobacillus acidoterrestris (strain ATCC 49025 / DSM 3922 / CIP 106132 / NCIMB 13137 / GD3B) TaxID=1356854 RepID=T0CUI0_ALIAG|nr:recombinase family protein [Alicyclobacillus acidoterrestris]EPZ43022.1 hypothetical protein N007_01395 [Alicyclobacillus acidoterrestris ATCC 49025]UNO49816.1 recombinase family protein [Alicyclobacillus acidoterrestris]
MSRVSQSISRAICYIRKSREDEEAERRGEDTLLKQRELMTRDVLSRYEFDYEIREEVASGDSIRERPVFRAILPELGTKYQAIVCKDLSRLGRGSYTDMGVVYDIIRDKRIYIITKDAVYDPRNFSDLRMIRFSLFFNREEYEMTLWRLTEGKYDGAQRGKWVAGSVPYGFRYHARLQILVPYEPEARIVQWIFRWYGEEGLGYSAIATRLRQLGIRSPRGKEIWRPEVIHRMLANPAYCGTLVFRRTQRNKHDGKVVVRPRDEHIVVEHAFEAIVETSLWSLVQKRLKSTARTPKVKADFTPSELAGLVTCGGCGRKMVRQSSVQRYRKRDGTISKYTKEFMYCPVCGYAVKYRDCEKQLLTALHHVAKIDPTRFAQCLESSTQNLKVPVGLTTKDIQKQCQARAAALNARLERARDLLLDGTLTKQDYQEIREKCQTELAEIAKWTTDFMDSALPCAPPTLPISKAQIRSLVDGYQQLSDTAAKNRFLRGLLIDVRLELVHKGRHRSDPTRFDLQVTLHPNVTRA